MPFDEIHRLLAICAIVVPVSCFVTRDLPAVPGYRVQVQVPVRYAVPVSGTLEVVAFSLAAAEFANVSPQPRDDVGIEAGLSPRLPTPRFAAEDRHGGICIDGGCLGSWKPGAQR